MLVHVKTPPTDKRGEVDVEIRIEGPGASKVLADLKSFYRDDLIVDEDDEYVPVRSVDWIREGMEALTPGKSLKIYRSNRKMTLTVLAELSGIPAGNLSAMENDKRPIGKKTAEKLAKVLDCDYRSLL